MIQLKTLLTHIHIRKSSTEISIDDLKKSIAALSILGNSLNIIRVGKSEYLSSLAGEFNDDFGVVVNLAQVNIIWGCLFTLAMLGYRICY